MPPPAHRPFRCEVQPARELVLVRPVGELDLATLDEVDAALHALRASGFERIVVDLRETAFLDCASVAMLRRHHRAGRDDGFRLEIIAAGGIVGRVLDLTGALDELALLDPDTRRLARRGAGDEPAGELALG